MYNPVNNFAFHAFIRLYHGRMEVLMKYGYFDDDSREFVITTPATPLPWINYLGTEDFFGLISNTGGGYCFYRDARLRRLLRFRYNTPGGDIGGRFFYIKEDGKRAWSPCFLPCKTPLDDYRCRHGLGYTVFEGTKDDISASLTITVPPGDACELHMVTLKNMSDQQRSLQFYTAVEWCLWDAVDDAQNYQRNLSIGEVEITPSVIYHTSEYRERRNHYAFYGTAAHTHGFDTDRDTFTGRFGGWEQPDSVEEGTSYNSHAHGWYPIACHRVDISLSPGEEKTFVFVLGYGENDVRHKFQEDGTIVKTDAQRLIARYSDAASVSRVLDDLGIYWSSLLDRYSITSSEPRLNRMVNIWNQYQCMVTFNMSRSASYYETGTGRGMGFRDSCQDLLGFVHMIPERARERIIDIASVQMEDGSTYHQYQPLTKQGNDAIGSGFNDDPLWLIGATVAYIKETGDASILQHPTPFDTTSGTEVPLLEHLRRSIQYTLSHLGPHGLPLIGHADWNDCLNLNCFSERPGESFQCLSPKDSDSSVAESVFIAGMFVYYGRQYVELCEHFGENKEEELRDAIAAMEQAVIDSGWDGAWYLRAYDAFGNKVGSQTCTEGKLFIEPQGFCAMAQIGKDQGLCDTALQSVQEHLTFRFGSELVWPRYTAYHKELGEITSYPPGYKENGAVFCHNNPWISIAAAINGHGNMAFDVYRRICPAWNEDFSETHRTEPYVYSQMVAGRDAATPGEAKNSWLTGTAAWSFVDISQFILGIQPDYDGLRIRPCLPDWLEEYTVTRIFRGATYHIHVVNQHHTVTDTFVPFIPGQEEYDVEVIC
jgi:cellobiose phosphorylase